MLSAVVAIDGSLGEVVAQTLQCASPRWDTRRVARGDESKGAADVVIVDEELPGDEQQRVARNWRAPVIVIGRDVEKPFAVAALRATALSVVQRAPADSGGIIAVDRPLRTALEIVETAAPRGGGVLVTGPTGVGKELLARRVHERSGRRGAFVPVNCAAFSEGLVESALFGHVRGAFTGASSRVPGAFVEAEGGTLFLDEVGELEPRIQAKLLRALEDASVRALGATEPRKVDVRIVAATNRDLRAEIERGAFRSDLYFRLATFVVDVPALRERPRDLGALIERLGASHDRAAEVRLTRAARAALVAYSWPGNVRELRNVLERVFALAPAGEVSREELDRLAPELRGTERQVPEGARASVERRYLERAIDGELTKRRAAAELGVHRSTLWRKMKRLKEGTA